MCSESSVITDLHNFPSVQFSLEYVGISPAFSPACLRHLIEKEALSAEEVRFRLSLIQAWPSFLFLIIETVADAAFFVLILQLMHHFWLP